MISFTMNKGLWLKGCLHCHSTLSDGVLSPEDVAHFYEERGYTLLSITDHNKISKVKEFRGIYHYGIEISKGRCKLGESYHIVILGIDDPAILNMDDVQSIIDYSKEAGGLAFIAHPYWSNLVHEDLDKLEGYVGIEIYNTGCDVEVAKGYSLIHWDGLLTLSRKTWGIAVDDSHRYFKPPIDADG
ncbi:MAG: PHP domain-containing protein, partial [Candidatus Bathyarchaeia archaeon]